MEQSNEPKTKYDLKLQKLLEYCQSEKNYYDNPCQYEEDAYYIKCRAKADILYDVIREIKLLMETKET